MRAMPFPKKLLNSYEDMVVDLHPHWLFLWRQVAAFVAGIILFLVWATARLHGWKNTGLLWLSLVVLLVSALWLLRRYLIWRTTNFCITTDRLIFRHGVVAKSGIEIPLERVNNVNFSQSIFERMLGAGSLLIESGGEDGQQRFTHIPHPERVQNEIHAQIEQNDRRKMGVASSAAAAPNDVATQLEKLEGLLTRGSISQAEFDAEKARLLGA